MRLLHDRQDREHLASSILQTIGFLLGTACQGGQRAATARNTSYPTGKRSAKLGTRAAVHFHGPCLHMNYLFNRFATV